MTESSSTAKLGRVLAVASGKGGVGKTWFSTTLAHSFAKLGYKVLVFDADLGLANVDIQLGLMPERDVGSVVTGQMTMAQAVIKYDKGSFDVIAGRSGSGSLAALSPERLNELRHELMVLAKNYDFTIIDLGAGVEKSIRAMAADVNTTLVVTTEEPTALIDAYTYIKVTLGEHPRSDLRVVVNMASNKQEGERAFSTITRGCRTYLKFSPPLAGIIRRDRYVSESIRNQTGILTRHPNADAASDVTAIAKLLIEQN